jgi:hypothetical protein
VKYEEVYLHAYANGTEAREALTRYFSFYNPPSYCLTSLCH